MPSDAAASGSAATGSPEPPPTAARQTLEWTGWQTLAVDLAGLAIGIGVASSVESSASEVGLVAGTWYGIGMVGAPVSHYANKHWPTGLADFAMRSILPALTGVGGLVVECLGDEIDGPCTKHGFAAGMLIGLGGAAVFDAFVLSQASTHDAPGTAGEWYGLQILAIDLISYAFGVWLAVKEPKEGKDRPHPGLSLWVMDYIIGTIASPIVHFAHGNIGQGFGALGARLLLSPIGAVLGIIGACGPTAGNDGCTAEGAQYGLLGGSLVVALFDAFVFAREKAPESSTPTASNFDFSIGAGSLGLRARW